MGGRHKRSVYEITPELCLGFKCPPVDNVVVLAGVLGGVFLAQLGLHFFEILFNE